MVMTFLIKKPLTYTTPLNTLKSDNVIFANITSADDGYLVATHSVISRLIRAVGDIIVFLNRLFRYLCGFFGP